MCTIDFGSLQTVKLTHTSNNVNAFYIYNVTASVGGKLVKAMVGGQDLVGVGEEKKLICCGAYT